MDPTTSYAEAYERIRNVTGYGAGNGPVRRSFSLPSFDSANRRGVPSQVLCADSEPTPPSLADQVVVIHDGFKGTRRWAHFLETQMSFRVNVNAKGRPIASGGRNKHKVETKTRWIAGLDRVALDSHRYTAFLAPQQFGGIEDHLMKVRPRVSARLLLLSRCRTDLALQKRVLYGVR